MAVKENFKQIRDVIPKNVALVSAVKYASEQQIMELAEAGLRNFGFNTYQQLALIKELLPKDARVHFIGHLQSNKVKKVMQLGVYLIQSVDSYRLAEKINKTAKEAAINQSILLQVKTDESKQYGIKPAELEDIMLKIEKNLQNIKVEGLMTVPQIAEAEQARKYFSLMKRLFDELSKKIGRRLKYLSMGMSNDYKIAIEEGANMVRIGRALFE